MLKEAKVVVASNRSGHYLPKDFRQRALSLIAARQTETIKSPDRREQQLRTRLIARQHAEDIKKAKRIAVLLVGVLWNNTESIQSSLDARGIYVAASDAGYTVEFFVITGTAEKDKEIIDKLLHSRIEGVIIIRRLTGYRIAKIANTLLKQLIPVIAIYDDTEGTDVVSVNFNNYAMGLQAGKLLAGKKHRQVGVIYPTNPISNMRDRVAGFADALADYPDATLERIEVDEFSPASIEAAFKQVFESKVSAIFSTGFEIFVTLLPLLKKHRIRIPQHLSVIACSSIADIPFPPGKLDILHMDFTSIGKTAFKALTDYQRGNVQQRCYLVNPPYQENGSVKVLKPRKKTKQSLS